MEKNSVQFLQFISEYHYEDLEKKINELLLIYKDHYICSNITYFNLESNDGNCGAYLLFTPKIKAEE